MKTKQINRLCLSLAAGAALLGAANSHAQTLTTSWTNTFDADADASSNWCWWYDMYQQAYGFGYNALITNSWDSTMNSTLPAPPNGGAGSGSLALWTYWPGVPENSGKGGQVLDYGTFGKGSQYDTSQTADATKYDSLSFDLYVDPASPLDQASNVCVLTVGFFKQDYSTYTITNVPISTNNFGKWLRYVCPIDKATAPNTSGQLAAGPMFNINCYGGENVNLFTNTVPTKMWVDNLYLKLSTVVVPPPRISTKFTEPKPGLNLFSGGPSSDQYQRNNIKFLGNTGVGWLGQTGVTYSVTITNFPDGTAYSGYQQHLFITTGPGTYNGLDYSETNVVWMNVSANSNNTASVAFRYKINEPQANSNMFGAEYIGVASAGTLVNMQAPTPLGTFSLTFNNDTNITITGPGGVSTNFNMRPEAVAPFIEPLNVVIGAQPNQPYNVGQEVVIASVSGTNASTGTPIFADDFIADGFLNPGFWSILTGEPNTVFVFPLDPGQKLVSWSTPDAGFGLQVNTNSVARADAWTTLSGSEATGTPLSSYTSGGSRITLVPSANLAPDKDYFRLFTRKFAKLQLLAPGEISVPGTPTGKQGTPDPQTAGVAFNVTVNAVDANWFPATYAADHVIHLTCTDGSATLPTSDPQMIAGTAVISVTLNATGTWTVTATDVTDASKTASTSAGIMVP